MNKRKIQRRFRIWMAVFMGGLVISGITAFAVESELTALTSMLPGRGNALSVWLQKVDSAVVMTNHQYPFLAYGTDWLAFAHIVIAMAFIGPLIDPVRNKWLITFGLIACGGVVPLALIAGGIRGIPLGWRCVDICFGVVGCIPLVICRRCILLIEQLDEVTIRRV